LRKRENIFSEEEEEEARPRRAKVLEDCLVVW